MMQFGFDWPEYLNCELLPGNGETDVVPTTGQATGTEGKICE